MQFPGYAFYGGATITRTFDAAGWEYVACCAHRLEGSNKVDFGFYIFKRLNAGAWQRVPLQHFCTGRGSINGGGWWIAADKSDFFTDAIPGFAPYPQPGTGPAGPTGPQGPAGPQGPQGETGSGGGLSARYTEALERLCAWLGIV